MPRGAVQRIGWHTEGDCWIWDGNISPPGYGRCNRIVDGVRHALAHRWAYHKFVGPIPDGMEVDHLCRRRDCINPEHLEPVTRAENNQRAHVYRRPKKLADRCGNGHRFDEASTYIDPRGYRQCRICRTAAVRRVYARRKQSHQDTQT